jgi:hypothetical protein
MSKDDVAEYLLMVLGWEGVRGEKGVMVDAVQRWRHTPGLSFADGYLAALAAQRRCPVVPCTRRTSASLPAKG